jgi:uncharacterized protein YjbJ (UPF0337 family)
MNTDQTKGKIKEAAGALTDDENLKNQGKADQFVGDVKEAVDDVAEKTKDVVDDVKKAIHKD